MVGIRSLRVGCPPGGEDYTVSLLTVKLVEG
jgi:hypothetical protein